MREKSKQDYGRIKVLGEAGKGKIKSVSKGVNL